MSSFIGDEERENLESLKQDLLNPLKSFVDEVREDTVGDAKRYYSAKARRAQRDVKLAQDRAKAQMEAMKREQEARQRQRRAAMKRAAIALAVLALLAVILISTALSAHAEEPDYINLGNATLASVLPDHEMAELNFQYADLHGEVES